MLGSLQLLKPRQVLLGNVSKTIPVEASKVPHVGRDGNHYMYRVVHNLLLGGTGYKDYI